MDEWLTLDEARARLGLHPDTLRKQVRQGKREGRKDNHGRWVIRVGPDSSGRIEPDDPAGRPAVTARADPDLTRVLAGKDVELARLEERLAAAEEARAELRRELGEVKSERDRLLALLETTLAERRPGRRPWPGLQSWWRRLWEGEG